MIITGRFSVAVLLATLLSAATTRAQYDAHWLYPASGNWNAASNWSTYPSWPNGTPYHVTIDAAGAPYSVTAGQNITVLDVTVDSPDATLVLDSGAYFTANQGIHVERGKATLNAGYLVNTRLSNGPAGTLLLGSTPTVLTNVSLAGELRATLEARTSGIFTLDGATIYAADGMISGSVLGNGEWVLSSNNACTNNICRLDYSGGPAVIGAGVTMRGAGRRVYMFENTINNSDVLVNRGNLRAETPGGYWYVERLQNEGTIRVNNGDYFGAGFFGNVGTLQLGPGGTLELQGSPQFNLPTTIDGATLVLNASGGATTVQPLTLANGIIRLAHPASGVPISSTSASGAIYIGATVTPAQLAAMPVSGPAIVRFDGSAFGFSGALDLAGTTFDYTSTGYNWSFVQGLIRNGTFTGPNSPIAVGGTPGLNFIFKFDGVQVDVPLQVTGATQVQGTSTLLKPVVVAAGSLSLFNTWTNTGGINVTNGTLHLATRPATLGNIQFTTGELQLGFSTTLSDAESLDVGTPNRIYFQSTTKDVATLDLQNTTLELETSHFAWGAGTTGRITNGHIAGTLSGRTLALRSGQLSNVTLDSVRVTGSGTLSGVSGSNVWMGSATASATTLTGSRIDGSVTAGYNIQTATPGLTIVGSLELNGSLSGSQGKTTLPSFRFAAGSSLTGTGQIGNTTGRLQGTFVEILDSDFTIPVGITLISATQYDSTDTIEAPSTNLTVAGRILAGYTTQFGGAITDSWMFHVASLRTNGNVDVTNDGRINVQGGAWRHAGHLTIDGGRIVADSIEVEPAGLFEGHGTLDVGAAGMNVSGVLAPGTPLGQLALNGNVGFSTAGTLAIELRGSDNSNPAAPQYDRFNTTGAAALAGVLSVTLGNGFNPSVGTSFDILDWGTLTGIFGSLQLPAFTNGLIWNTSQLYNTGLISIAAALPGDFNADGFVDAADYVAWRKTDGTQAGYDAWRAHFGTSLNSGSGSSLPSDQSLSASVPEPAALALLLTAAGMSLGRRSKALAVSKLVRA